MSTSKIPEILRQHEGTLLDDWTREQKQLTDTSNRLSDAELRAQSRRFLQLVQEAATRGNAVDIDGDAYKEVRKFLEEVSASRAALGFSPSETATFVFSFKQPLFAQIRASIPKAEEQVDEIWSATLLLDKLGLFTTEMYQKSREAVILRQQEEMLELSTPVVKLWEGVLALPIIGTLDSSRTQTIMESLLDAGADVNAQANNGITALVYAVLGGDSEMVRLLLERGADVTKWGDLIASARSLDRRTYLDKAEAQCVQKLISEAYEAVYEKAARAATKKH